MSQAIWREAIPTFQLDLQAMPQMKETTHVLIVDDRRDIREPLAKYLRQQDLRVSVACDAADARRLLESSRFDVAIVDVMMPGEDGLSLCRHMQSTSKIPTILLSALAEEADRIIGLEVGADDYVIKPFNPRELLARIRAVLRRWHADPPITEPPPPTQQAFQGWRLSDVKRCAYHEDGRTVALTTTELHLLSELLRRPGCVMSRDQLLDLVKGRAAVLYDRTIDNHISRLRQKLETNPETPEIIQTVWGYGYKLVADVDVPADLNLQEASK